MLRVFFSDVFDAKVIDDEAEGDGARCVLEEAWDALGLDVAMSGKVGNKLVVGNAAGLGKAIHAFSDFNVDKALVVGKFEEVVLVNDGLGNDFERDAHVFIAFHIVVEEEVFDVHSHEPSIGGGDSAVDDELGSDEAGCFCAHLKGVVNFVSTNCVADSACFGFEGAISTDDAHVGGFAALGDGRFVDEVHCVGAFDGFVALAESAKFVAVGFFPLRAIAGLDEFRVFCREIGVWG